MGKKILVSLLLLVWIFFGLYLFLPTPTVPDLPDSLKSDEPGDTTQVANVTAYYSDKSREQVVAFYVKAFGTIHGIPVPQYRLNHPPEFAQERIRNELKVWYFEEIVHPFRESLYVAGWTPALAQLSEPWRELPVEKKGVIYYQKTTVRLMPTSLWERFLVYGLTTVALMGMYYVGKKILKEKF